MLKNKLTLISVVCLILIGFFSFEFAYTKKLSQRRIADINKTVITSEPEDIIQINNTPTYTHKDSTPDKPNIKTVGPVSAKQIKKTISTEEYLHNLKLIQYEIKQEDTLSKICRKYKETCNPNTCINIIKRLNNLQNIDNIEPGSVIYIPENMFKDGKLYKVQEGDTWYKIISKEFSEYDTEAIMKLIVELNALPNNDLPLGEKVFLPKL